LLERLAILYPDQTIGAADLPERYRAGESAPFLGGDVRILSVAEAGDDEAEEVRFVSCESGDEDPAVQSALQNGGINLKDHLSAIEIGLIRKALEQADGTVAEAARLLNMRRTTLVEKLRKYRLCA
jgi:sigma-54 specific flagellar transcriptional regulator A